MRKTKVCVYTICKNEMRFIARYLESIKDADMIHIADTGSDDGTLEYLLSDEVRKKYPSLVVMTEEISPWRFDAARNKQLTDIYARTGDDWVYFQADVDEVIVGDGWKRKIIESFADPSVTRGTYMYVFNYMPDGSEGVVFDADKIHDRRYIWVNAVHEVLRPSPGETFIGKQVHVSGFTLEHRTLYKPTRASYIDLLKQSVEDDPTNDRNLHYYGRELVFTGQNDEGIAMLKRHLSVGQWAPEKASSCRYIGDAYRAKGDLGSALEWYGRGVTECPGNREPYYWKCKCLYDMKMWNDLTECCKSAISVRHQETSYLRETDAYGYRFYDWMSISLWYGSGDKAMSLAMAYAAYGSAMDMLGVSPEETARLHSNVMCCK